MSMYCIIVWSKEKTMIPIDYYEQEQYSWKATLKEYIQK